MIPTNNIQERQEARDAKRDLKVKKLKDAFEVDGPHPTYHEDQKALLKQNWGVLYDAIINLIK